MGCCYGLRIAQRREFSCRNYAVVPYNFIVVEPNSPIGFAPVDKISVDIMFGKELNKIYGPILNFQFQNIDINIKTDLYEIFCILKYQIQRLQEKDPE